MSTTTTVPRPAHRIARWLLALAALGAGEAGAQRKPDAPVAGRFEATFELVSSNCKQTGMNLTKAVVELGEPSRGKVDVTIPMVPFMKGTARRGGKFEAEAKRGKTGIAGLEGRFSIAGRVEDAAMQFLLIAEYFKDGKPFCTQSWNASGARR